MIINYILNIITFILSVFFLFDVSTSNPGVVPRGNMTYDEYQACDEKTIKIKDEIITQKYCDTCKIIRPPRSFHCSICGNCIDFHGID
jgi:hypothetical protein